MTLAWPVVDIRLAQNDDAGAIARIHTASWRDAYRGVLDDDFLNGPIADDRQNLWQNRLANPSANQVIYLTTEAHDPTGFVCLYVRAHPEMGAHIDNLHVHPNYRNRGIGERLFVHAARAATDFFPGTDLFLWVFEANTAARRFYERLGGKIVESDRSLIPAAHGKTVLRLTWSNDQLLGMAKTRREPGSE